ncbi:MAG: GDYXXLXY domain-containing protein [Pseudomonadota bacterium]
MTEMPSGDAAAPDAGIQAGQDARPWPVVLLTALGAWLAAVPLLVVVGSLLGDFVIRGVGSYVVGTLVLAGAVVVLRSRPIPVFVEQLAVPALLVGGGSLAFGLYRDLPVQLASLAIAALAAGVAAALPHAWLRVLLGAACAGFAAVALVPTRLLEVERAPLNVLWAALHGLLVLWLAMLAARRKWLHTGARARHGAALEPFAGGWVLAVLAALCGLAGMTFLVGGSLGAGLAADLTRAAGTERHGGIHLLTQAGSAAMACAAALWLAREVPGLRQALAACVALVLVALSWFMPTLGGVWLCLVVLASTQRWRLAGAAAFAAAWIIGAFYYQLAWPLGQKAVVLVVAGAALGGLAWLAARSRAAGGSETRETNGEAGRRNAALIAATALATLLVANFAIWQKQELIATGRPVFVELAPVDPRSLMQGDYMRLNYRLPDNASTALDPLRKFGRPHVVVALDGRGVARMIRIEDPSSPATGGETRIELTPKDGRWVIVSDAWFFREGDGERWTAAKYGEFRVAPDGRALLVGLADANLKRIEP